MNRSISSINEMYSNLMRGYEPSPSVNNGWQMEGGVYRQYSAFENNESCPSGTDGSLRAITL